MTHTTIEARSVQVTADSVALEGTLNIPESPQGLVVFVHGSGSSRNSSRNRHVARVLQEGSLATLLFNLLTAQEERVDRVTRHLRFDIDLLASRTTGAIDWVQQQPEARDLPLGLFGASTGAAAALIAAARRPFGPSSRGAAGPTWPDWC
jgi:putative phosphoribosyl transferase